MDLGLDDYSDSSPELKPNQPTSDNTDSESEVDWQTFSIKTKSVLSNVTLDAAPTTLLSQVGGVMVEKSEDKTSSGQNGQNGTPANAKPDQFQKVYYDRSEFDKLYHQSKKESAAMLQYREEKRQKYREGENTGDGAMREALDSVTSLTKRKNLQRVEVGDDKDDDGFNTGSWALYEGEKENKARVAELNKIKKQKKLDQSVDEFGNELDAAEQRQIARDAVRLATTESSTYYPKITFRGPGPAGTDGAQNVISEDNFSRFRTTTSASSVYLDFDYNTPSYLKNVLPNKAKYMENVSRLPSEIEGIKEQDELRAQIARKDLSTLPHLCYDAYSDILLSTALKVRPGATKGPNGEKMDAPLGYTGLNNNERNPEGLRTFLDLPPDASPINRTPFLSRLDAPQISQPKPDRNPYIDIISTHIQGGAKATLGAQSGQAQSISNSSDPIGISLIRFFPYSAQFIAAGHLDGSVKLYSTDRQIVTDSNQSYGGCIRSYTGHSSGLTSFHWVDDGRRFLTCSHDGWSKLWDTETGKVVFRKNSTVGNFKGHATPQCSVTDGTTLTIGTGDGHITAYDYRTGRETIEYHQMQTTITTMVEIPSGNNPKSFLAAAADGQIFVYHHGIPSVYQHVTQHDQKMITRACVHPSEAFIIANSHSDSAMIFRIDAESTKVKLNHKKTFTGHKTAGHHVGLVCSPDGEYLLSGDGTGKLMCWNFKSGKLASSPKLFSSVTSDVDWAWGSNMFAAASWDGHLKIYKN